MVRRLVYVQIAVATGRANLDRLRDSMEAGLPELPGIAPARGLVLCDVKYGE
jgi:tRNA U38,U39,U40 pseudouridine synthase TruA